MNDHGPTDQPHRTGEPAANAAAPASAVTVDPDKLTIVHYPAPILRRKAEPVRKIDDTVRRVVRRMFHLMHEAPGVGLAAPQVGLPWRLFVANPTGEPHDDRVFINPVITPVGKRSSGLEEGCLSLPNIVAEVRRPTTVTIRAYDLEGKAFEMTSSDSAARVWQHEFDHLEGVLIIDRMTPFDRETNKRFIEELEH